MNRYVVANRDWMGGIVEVFPVEEMFTINGKLTDDVGEAVSCVVRSSAGHHAVDLSAVPIFSVH